MWGLTPIVTNSMAKSNFLVGDFGPASAQNIERQASMLEISFQRADFFTRNLAALRGEERIDLAVYRPFAFVKGALTAPTATTAHANKQPEGNPAHVRK